MAGRHPRLRYRSITGSDVLLPAFFATASATSASASAAGLSGWATTTGLPASASSASPGLERHPSEKRRPEFFRQPGAAAGAEEVDDGCRNRGR